MNLIHAIVFLQNWGDGDELIATLKRDPHVISMFHIMGRHSYLIDANFDNKPQLGAWVGRLKSIKLQSGVPAVISIETQKIIDIIKTKADFNLGDYQGVAEKYHFFVKIDNPHHDEKLITLLRDSEIVQSNLHVQGECSYIAEVISDQYSSYKDLLAKVKKLESIHHIETQEVISVLKYRSRVMDERGNQVFPKDDIREMYSL